MGDGEGGVGEEGDGGEGWVCLDLSLASMASEAMFFSLTILADKLFKVFMNNNETETNTTITSNTNLHNLLSFLRRHLSPSFLQFGYQHLWHMYRLHTEV